MGLAFQARSEVTGPQRQGFLDWNATPRGVGMDLSVYL